MLRCYGCGNLSAAEPSELCPRCVALRPGTVEGAEAAPRVHVRYPATWSIICITIATSILGYAFRESVVPLGAAVPWRTIGGNQWWRLLTSSFVHQGLEHAFSNLFVLWIVGKRLERNTGWRVFVGLYLAIGLTASFASLAFNPERTCFGASAAVYGVAAAVIALYGVRFSTLTNSQKWRLGFLLFFIVGCIVAGFFDQETDNTGHVSGFVAGLVLGLLFASRFGQTTAQRVRIFAVMGVLLLSGSIWLRLAHPYLVHVNAAERALDRKEYDHAARELHLALAMQSGSRVAQRFAIQLEAERSPRANYCASLPPDPIQLERVIDPCGGRQCDGQVHAFPVSDAAQAYYVGTVMTTTPLSANGGMERESTATVTMQALDEYGEIGCTVKWSQISRQQVDDNGNS